VAVPGAVRQYSIAVVVSVACLAAVLAQAPATVLDGVYTTAQAERGHVVYESRCIQCHEGLEADGPELTNKAFLDRWREDTLASLFTFIKTTMPGNTPGSLDDRAYADVIAFLLEANGLPAGPSELRPAMVGSIQLVGPEGPRPLANLTIVRAVGCLSPAANDTWMLVKASGPRPVRARIVEGTSPEELKASTAQPLGAQTFPLMSVPPQAASYAGHKVQVKGVLTRQNALERINIMSLDSVGPVCGG
jgi:S-disulfanyl-L-cysteine oxidoreductase SoxD